MFNEEEFMIYRMYFNPSFRVKAVKLLQPEHLTDNQIHDLFVAFSETVAGWDEARLFDSLSAENGECLSRIITNSSYTMGDGDYVLGSLIRKYKERKTREIFERYKDDTENAHKAIGEIIRLNNISEESSFEKITKQTENYLKTLTDTGAYFPTCWSKLNKITKGGLKRKRIWTVGGYTSHGKSMVGISLFWDWVKRGFRCAYFSTEMSYEDIISRIVNMEFEKQIDPNPAMSLETHAEVKKTTTLINGFNPHIYDDLYEPGLIEKELMGIKHELGLDIVIIDFIQNLEGIRAGESSYERMSGVIRWAQNLAKKQDIGMVVFSQLSNEMAKELRGQVEEDEGEIPFIAYKGAGEIAAAVDMGAIIILQGDKMNFYVGKQRHGMKGRFKLQFENNWTKLVEVNF